MMIKKFKDMIESEKTEAGKKFAMETIVGILGCDPSEASEEQQLEKFAAWDSEAPVQDEKPHGELPEVEITEDIEEETEIYPGQFPYHVFTEDVKTYCNQTADSLSMNRDAAYASMLSVYGSLVGRREFSVPNKNWSGDVRLCMIIVGDPGMGKSPLLRSMSEVLFRLDVIENEENVKMSRLYKKEMAEYKKASKKDSTLEEPETPKYVYVTASNVTPEKLEDMLRYSTSIHMLLDEADSLISFDTYKQKGKGRAKQDFQTVLSGGSLQSHRKSDDTEMKSMIRKPHLNILGCTTPDSINVFFPEKNDGFSDRLLFCAPSRLEKKWDTKDIDLVHSEKMIAKFMDLYQSSKIKTVYKLTPEAYAAYGKFYEKSYESLTDSYQSKYIGLVLQMSLILTVMHEKLEIGIEEINGGIEIMNYFTGQMKLIMKRLGKIQTPYDISIERLKGTVKKLFTKKSVVRLNARYFQKNRYIKLVKEGKDFVDELVGRGYAIRIDDKTVEFIKERI